MRTGEAKVALEDRVWQLRRWLESADPVDVGSGNPEADRDAMRRRLHRQMMAHIEPFRVSLTALHERSPRFHPTDLLLLGAGFLQRRRAHNLRVEVAKNEMANAVVSYGAQSDSYKTQLNDGLALLDRRDDHARQVENAQKELRTAEDVLAYVSDVPAMTVMRTQPGQSIAGSLVAHAGEWRGRVVRKGLMDALVCVFPHSTPVSIEQGDETALLRGHPLYADMFCAAIEVMRAHPDIRRDPSAAERQVRQILMEAISGGHDPMDALVHEIGQANSHPVEGTAFALPSP